MESLESRTLLSATAAGVVAPAAQTAVPPSTAVTLRVSAPSALLGQSVKVSVAVKASKHAGKLAGGVELLDNGVPIVAAGSPLTLPLRHGKAVYTFGAGNAALFTGTHQISAQFVSSNTLPGSTSAATAVTVTAPPFTTASDGLGIATIKTGHGKAITAGRTAKVLYTGLLTSDGTVFDYATSPGHGPGAKPFFTFPVESSPEQVITGFDEGTLGMKKGETRVVEIPSALGYGPQGSPPSIPGNADLVFLITLLSFK